MSSWKLQKNSKWFRPQRAIGFDRKTQGTIEIQMPVGRRNHLESFRNCNNDRDGTVHQHTRCTPFIRCFKRFLKPLGPQTGCMQRISTQLKKNWKYLKKKLFYNDSILCAGDRRREDSGGPRGDCGGSTGSPASSIRGAPRGAAIEGIEREGRGAGSAFTPPFEPTLFRLLLKKMMKLISI